MEVSNFFKKNRINDRDQIKENYKIIEMVGHGDEKGFFFRNLEKEGNGKKQGEDDDSTQH